MINNVVLIGRLTRKLERQLLELYQDQAERTKKTAERNGVGG